jgi:hypothetical protein
MPTSQQETPYIVIRQDNNGDVTHVAVRDTPPEAETILTSPTRQTIWRCDSPQSEAATEIFNLACSTAYRDDDPIKWADGSRARAAFNAASDGERAFLRAVEARLVLAGHIDAYTAPVAEEHYGITLTHHGDTWHFYQLNQTWHAALDNQHSIDGWSVISEDVAPVTATATQLADAIRILLADHNEPTTDTVVKLDADQAVNHAADKLVGPEPTHKALKPAWAAWRAAVREHLTNGCRAVGIDQPDAVRNAIRATDYRRRTPSPSLTDEVHALTEAGAQWHHTPSGVFWTDPDQS